MFSPSMSTYVVLLSSPMRRDYGLAHDGDRATARDERAGWVA